MCLAIPAEIIDISDGVATCKVGEGDTTVQASTMLMDEEVALGDYIIIHAGFALRKLDPKEARETLKILRDMVELVGGAQRLDAHQKGDAGLGEAGAVVLRREEGDIDVGFGLRAADGLVEKKMRRRAIHVAVGRKAYNEHPRSRRFELGVAEGRVLARQVDAGTLKQGPLLFKELSIGHGAMIKGK